MHRLIVSGGLILVLVLIPATAVAIPVNGTLGINSSTLAGTDGSGRVLLYAPNPLEPGSSVSHFDLSAFPNLLMEPSASSSLSFAQLDLTLHQMLDIGWRSGSAQLTLRVQDGAGEGFNDPTRGAQRLAAMQFAAGVWASRLRSSVEINVDVAFNPLTCSDGSGTLAQAGAAFLFESFSGAPISGTWYHGALAESLSGTNLSLEDVNNPNAGDLSLTFNTQIDDGCLGSGSRFYYGLNGNVPTGQISFVNVALHELAHGLGFSTFTNNATGALFLNKPDIYNRFSFDNSRGKAWHQMSNSERRNSAINTGRLAWSGPRVTAQAPNFLQAAPALIINAPPEIAGNMQIGIAEFGPPITASGVSGDFAIARDASSNPTELCGSAVNSSELSGKIALIDRGDCLFVEKVKNAQNAGAVAAVIVNNISGAPPNLGGSDPSIVIPSAGISIQDGNLIKATLAEVGDPGTLRLSSSTYSSSETAGELSIAVERNGGTAGVASVTVSTADGTATAASDYLAFAQDVTFADGEGGSRTVALTILDDDVTEGDETLMVSLSSASGAPLGSPAAATVTIVDDDIAGVLELSRSLYLGSEGVGSLEISVTRSVGDLGSVSVDYTTVDGTAIGGEDFTPTAGTLTFADRDSAAKSFVIPILDDGVDEDQESFQILLSNPTGGATLGTNSSATAEIVDGCSASETNACVNGGRFEVSMTWRDFEGEVGDGRTVASGVDDSVLFYFFSENNWEALVKVLNGCGFNQRYWVFGTATTDVEYTLTVTDTLSGMTKQYFNPLGTASAALTDTDAFATCP